MNLRSACCLFKLLAYDNLRNGPIRAREYPLEPEHWAVSPGNERLHPVIRSGDDAKHDGDDGLGGQLRCSDAF